MTIETETIVCPGGMPAFLARPEGRGPFPVLVLERYGLVRHPTDLARRAAEDGFVSIAPNFFFRHPDQKSLNAGDSRYDMSDPESVELLNSALAAVKGNQTADLDHVA